MKKMLSEEFSRMSKLAGLINEDGERTPSPELTTEEKIKCEAIAENAINELASSGILDGDSEDYSPSKDERAIRVMIEYLTDTIDHYN